MKRAQAEGGELPGGRPPYGCKRDETGPKGIVADEEAAAVVKRIFSLCAKGKGPNRMVRILAGHINQKNSSELRREINTVQRISCGAGTRS